MRVRADRSMENGRNTGLCRVRRWRTRSIPGFVERAASSGHRGRGGTRPHHRLTCPCRRRLVDVRTAGTVHGYGYPLSSESTAASRSRRSYHPLGPSHPADRSQSRWARSRDCSASGAGDTPSGADFDPGQALEGSTRRSGFASTAPLFGERVRIRRAEHASP